MHLLNLIYEWVLAPLGLYTIVKPLVRATCCYYSLRRCVREANRMNHHIHHGLPRFRAFIRHAFVGLPPIKGPGFAWYGFGRWQVWEVEQRTDDSIFQRGKAAQPEEVK